MKITLANLHEATAQQVFDQVATHLLTQNAKSVHSIGESMCAYRSNRSKECLKCAAGCLIADEEYKPEMENRNWFSLIATGLVPTNVHSNLITELQYIHDNCGVRDWHARLLNIAETFGFDPEVLNKDSKPKPS